MLSALEFITGVDRLWMVARAPRANRSSGDTRGAPRGSRAGEDGGRGGHRVAAHAAKAAPAARSARERRPGVIDHRPARDSSLRMWIPYCGASSGTYPTSGTSSGATSM